jgi:outer membrane protein, multidrug efflux system
MVDGSRTRALVCKATSLRPFFVVFMGLCFVQMLSGCIFSSERPDITLDVPTKYGAGNGESAPPTLDWWRSFRSRELTNLIEEAQAVNFDIGAAIGRIMQADAQAKIIGAPLLPAVNFDGFAERLRNPGGPERNLFQAALNASYEIDFWGKNRAASRAAEQSAIVSRFNKEVVVLATIVSVASAYLQVLA